MSRRAPALVRSVVLRIHSMDRPPLLPPYGPSASHAASTDALVRSLLDFGGDDKKARKLVRSHVYNVALPQEEGGGEEVEVRSWNLWEFAYKRDPCPFPTRARGLFTSEKQGSKRPGEDGKGKYRIVARGYDKFFNVGEVAWTKVGPPSPPTVTRADPKQWENIPDHTTGPYYLTLKTNGCIIFISALSPSTLLITSKHAIGSHKTSPPANDEQNGYDSEPDDHAEEDLTTEAASSSRKSTFDGLTHAGVGSYWLSRHLSTLSAPFDSRAALAKELWDSNVTAVAELTDDAFEEHVLPTPSTQVGLNLHGLNRNVPGELETFRPEIVEAFAKRWGMHPTPHRKCATIEEVRKACREVEERGWDGTMVEGIVVRASPVEGAGDEEGVVKGAKFWKVKFDEPYLMYREWRELTRRLISDRKKLVKEFRARHPSATKDEEARYLEKELKGTVNPSKLRNPQSRGYAKWVLDTMASRDEGWFEEWAKGRAIVSTREEYLRSKAVDDGLEDGVAGLSVAEEKQTFDKVLLVPIAAPGCGPSLALCLSLHPKLRISTRQARRSSASP